MKVSSSFSSLCTITILMVFFETPPLTHAEQHHHQQQRQKLKRKTSDPSQQDNYIITHYGLEYYTPATESSSSSIQTHNDGYFTAEVIPVDPKTGQELRTINNLYVPLHTGYSIGGDKQRASQFTVPNDGKPINGRENDHQSQSTNIADKQSQSSASPKHKFDKKYKFKNADAAKKNSTAHVLSQRSDQESSSSRRGQDDKNTIKFVDDTNKRYEKFSTK